MKKYSIYLESFFILLLLTLVVLSALYFYPYAMEVPHRDSGIYLYLGKQLLSGKTIYAEIWEHKPPFIFYINAFGLWLGGSSGWGVWGVEVVFLFLTVIISYFTLRSKIKPLPSLVITAAVYSATFQYMSGNFTEEYALLFQAATIFVYLSNWFKKREPLQFFIIGILSGILFNIKQTYIDVTIAIVIIQFIAMLSSRNWKNLKYFFILGLGFLIPNLVVFVVMAVNNVIRDWWNTAYVFNFAYSDIGPLERIKAGVDIFRVNTKYPFFVMLWIAWLIGFLYLAHISLLHIFHFLYSKLGKRLLLLFGFSFLGLLIAGQFMGTRPGIGIIESIVISLAALSFIMFFLFNKVLKIDPAQRLKQISITPEPSNLNTENINTKDPFIIGIIHLPIVLFLATASGRNYPHYFIPFYSSFFLIFYGTYLVFRQKISVRIKPILNSVLFIVIFSIGMFQPFIKIQRGLGGPYSYNPYRELVQFIKDNSQEDDTVLVWGLETLINYLAERDAPSKYSYIDPVYYRSPIQSEATATILNDITSAPPKFILDRRNPEYPLVDGRSMEECLSAHPEDGSDLDKIIHFTCSNYKYIDRLNNVEIFELIEQ